MGRPASSVGRIARIDSPTWPGPPSGADPLADELHVVDQAADLWLVLRTQLVQPPLRHATSIGESTLEAGDEIWSFVTQGSNHLELVFGPGDDLAIAMLTRATTTSIAFLSDRCFVPVGANTRSTTHWGTVDRPPRRGVVLRLAERLARTSGALQRVGHGLRLGLGVVRAIHGTNATMERDEEPARLTAMPTNMWER
jgi:hypothetical protein